MQRSYLATIAAILAIVVAGAGYKYVRHVQYRRAIEIWSSSSAQWQAQVLQQSRRSQRLANSVVFLGDSLTVGMTVSNITERAENFGIDGDTIAGLVERIPRYNLKGARAEVVEIGTNDLAHRSMDAFGDNYRRLLSSLPPATPVIAISIPPLKQAEHDFAAEQARANAQIAQACSARLHCRFLDFTKELADSNGQLRRDYDVGDGMHLSSNGYAIWEKALAANLR